MFGRVEIRASDPGASAEFYDTVLSTLGIEPTGRWEWREFRIVPAGAASPPTRRLHIGFAAPSRDHVRAFWEAGTSAGHPDDGQPGPRPEYGPDYYGGFLLDPDGNSAEAVHHDDLPGAEAAIDHLWLRAADVSAARQFYSGLAAQTGFALRTDDAPERVQFADGDSSFSAVAGPSPTEHVLLGFASAGEPVSLQDPDGNRVELG